jgi:hypothetical protein
MHDCDDDTAAAAAAIDDCVGVIHCLISLSLSLFAQSRLRAFSEEKVKVLNTPSKQFLNPKNPLKRGFKKYAQKKNRSSSDRTPPPL